jgi:hypothetical protein
MDCSKTYIFDWRSYENRNVFRSGDIKFDTQERWNEYFKNEEKWYSFENCWTEEEYAQMMEEEWEEKRIWREKRDAELKLKKEENETRKNQIV